MPATPHKGGIVPESDKAKVSRQLQGPTAIKGGVVPQEVLEDSKPSSPPERLANSATGQSVRVQQMPSPPSPPPTPSSPSKETKAKEAPKEAVEQDFTGWTILGLKMDTTDPLIQWEIRKHPTTGEVVEVPVGKAAEEGATPTSTTDSLPPEAGLQEA